MLKNLDGIAIATLVFIIGFTTILIIAEIKKPTSPLCTQCNHNAKEMLNISRDTLKRINNLEIKMEEFRAWQKGQLPQISNSR